MPMNDTLSSLAEAPAHTGEPEARKIYLVGNPNVGKSVLFNALTGSYAVVSNYPGTTVEVSRSCVDLRGERVEVIDTPGMYSLHPITDEERVSRDILLSGSGTIVHVVDAKNLPRMLPLTLELAMMGRPLVLALNLMDEAEQAGVFIDAPLLSIALGIPVVELVATRGDGLPELRSRLSVTPPPPLPPHVPFPASVEAALEFLSEIAPDGARRFWALHLLEGDPATVELFPRTLERVVAARNLLGSPARQRALPADVAQAFHEAAKAMLDGIYRDGVHRGATTAQRVDGLLLNPWTGFPILGLVVYFGLYQFVGVLGGGTLVNFLESTVFGNWINPLFEKIFAAIVPWGTFRSLFVGEYGMLTLGVRYATAIILPVVGTFFLAFSVLEDTGYLPRLAMMLDRLFKGIGLNGRAVIPLVLGLGCDTMATMVTRILETKRERVIAT